MSGIITATVVVAVVGLLIGLFLGVAAIKFEVEVDPNMAWLIVSLSWTRLWSM